MTWIIEPIGCGGCTWCSAARQANDPGPAPLGAPHEAAAAAAPTTTGQLLPQRPVATWPLPVHLADGTVAWVPMNVPLPEAPAA